MLVITRLLGQFCRHSVHKYLHNCFPIDSSNLICGWKDNVPFEKLNEQGSVQLSFFVFLFPTRLFVSKTIIQCSLSYFTFVNIIETLFKRWQHHCLEYRIINSKTNHRKWDIIPILNSKELDLFQTLTTPVTNWIHSKACASLMIQTLSTPTAIQLNMLRKVCTPSSLITLSDCLERHIIPASTMNYTSCTYYSRRSLFFWRYWGLLVRLAFMI
jgi:hypothetical protein